MKKNLRIVSAAAAALLAVAPIAATGVATAQAGTLQINHASETSNADLKQAARDAVNHALTGVAGTDLSSSITSPSNIDVVSTHLVAGTISSVDDPSFTTVSGERTEATVKVHLNGGVITIISSDPMPSSGSVSFSLNGETYSTGADPSDPHHITYDGPETGVSGRYVFQAKVDHITVHFPLTAPTSGNAEAAGSYFSTLDGNELANDATVTAPFRYTPSGDRNVTIRTLKKDIMHIVAFRKPNNSGYNTAEWNRYIFGDGNATDDAHIISQLRNQGIAVSGSGDFATFKAGTTQYTIILRSNGGKRVHIVFQDTGAVNSDAPAFRVRSDYRTSNGATGSKLDLDERSTAWSAPFNDNNVVPTINLVQRDNGTFNPLDYIEAINNVNQKGKINFTVKSNNVDWTKPGLYSVEVTATYNKKTTDVTIPVVVSAENGKLMTATKDTNYYRLDSQGNLVEVNLVNNAIHSGQAVRVYGAAVTHKLNGQDVQVYRVASPSSNLYVLASDLKGYQAPTNGQTVTKTINHIAAIYDKDGNQTNDQKLRAYDSVQVLSTTVTIKGSKMYQLVENGKAVDKYVKASNIDGTSKTLKHNSYVYTQYGHKVYKKNGKAVKMPKRGKRGSLRKVASGSTVTVYGGALFNKQYYRIGHNQYIKVANFR